MAKLYFRFGTMNSSKTLNCLAVAHNYESYQNKPIFLIKPSKDIRSEYVESRTGLKRKADLVLKPSDIDIIPHILKFNKKVYCVLVDEAQFLSELQVYELTEIVDKLKIPVIAYGLKCNFQNHFRGFEGSEALIRWSDKIEEIKTVCFKETCNKKAIHNMRLKNGKPTFEGEEIVIGDVNSNKNKERESDVDYMPVCRSCYKNEMNQYKNSEGERKYVFRL